MIPGLYTLFQEKWADKQAIWVYSDPHFGDKELAAGTPGRPSDEEQIKLINSKVGKKDVLIILGDCGDPAMCAKLRGYKVLIMGNLDAGRSNYERRIFTYDFPKDHYTKSSALASMKQTFPIAGILLMNTRLLNIGKLLQIMVFLMKSMRDPLCLVKNLFSLMSLLIQIGHLIFMAIVTRGQCDEMPII